MHDELGFFFENHPDAMFVYDPKTLKFLAVNRTAIEVYGYSREEFLEMTLAALRPAEDVPRLLEAIKRIDGRRVGGYIWRHLTRAGKTLLVDIVSQAIQYHGRDARLVVARNITATAQLQTFFEALPGKFLVVDAENFSIVAASDDYLKVTQRKRDELKGRPLFEAFPEDPDDPSSEDGVSTLRRSLVRVVETGHTDTMGVQRYPIPVKGYNGTEFEERFWSVVNSPIKGGDEHVTYIIHRVEDVTDFVKMAGSANALSPLAQESREAQLATEILLRAQELKDTNQRLQAQEAHLRLAQRLLSLAVWNINLRSGQMYWSDNLYTLCGVSPAEIDHSVDYLINELIHPDDRARTRQLLEDYQRNPEGPMAFAHRFVRPRDQSVVHFRGLAEIQTGESGNPILTGIILDVTQEVETQLRLDAAAGMQRIADKAAKLGGWRVNLHEDFVRWSEQTARIHERPETLRPSLEEAMSFYTPEYRARIQKVFSACITEGRPFDEVLQIIKAVSGERAWVRAIGEPLRNEQGDIVGAQGAFQDITDQVKIQEESSALAQRLAQTLDNMSDAFYLLDKDLIFVYLNPQAEKLLRCSRDAVVGQFLFDAFPRTKHTEIARQIDKALVEQKSMEFTHYSEQFECWFETNIYPSYDSIAVYFRDVTERREMAERLNQSQKMEAVGQLTGGVAHDFNNLLTVIMGNAELLRESLDDHPNLRIYAEMTANAAERGAELTNRLLAFARRQALEPKLTDINRLVSDMEHLLRRTLSEDIDIELVRGGGLWNAEVDPSQLESALLNMAINARDAMPEGGKLTIETANARLDDAYADTHPGVDAGQYVMISVSDTGSGMTEAVKRRVFEPFFTTKPVGKGNGLGLPMVYGFVKQSGGHIKVYSEVSEGTTIRLYFPRAFKEGQVDMEQPAPKKLQTGHEHILVVEDDDMVREHVTNLLMGMGYRVSSASSGIEALASLQARNDFDLLFTDIIMPGGMNGRQLADEALKSLPNLKVLFTSGYTENAIVHHGRLDAGVHLLGKPYRRHELATKVRKVLDET
ncbi:PAS domain S-box protein [Pusillimonas sp. DMV24BSW_D]|uniref:PAS domain S-box protein n=1 Tax=Neopusillimonas aestuarii TaxID=2716226 RepID=UPI00140E8F5F|nr:PAS domain S-box protein [Pusillimonas sp. DMV24BSW_D]QIM48160.1 PAS domain S-box protein [Pusillimonas sp. DMV24BSW_D]